MTTDPMPISDRASPVEDEREDVSEVPVSPSRSSFSDRPVNRQRHSKRLSVNVPILSPGPPVSVSVFQPSRYSFPSPSRGSPVHNTPASVPLTPPLEASESPDYLTLLAAQERKVLELREELSKAENELNALKKQWAQYEADKKRGEFKHKVVKLEPVSPRTKQTAEDEVVDRERRKEAREKRLKGLGILDADLNGPHAATLPGRRPGQRVFEGRHTRTLSLLQQTSRAVESTANTSVSPSSTDNEMPALQRRATESSTDSVSKLSKSLAKPSLSRQSTMQELSSHGAEALSFGKTYKHLASASRKSIPPGADEFMKQGKQVYEGVSQGFWNFVEDIRQATVGEEAVNGSPAAKSRDLRRTRSQLSRESTRSERPGSGNTQGTKDSRDKNKREKDNFWNEFGIETPKAPKTGNRSTIEQSSNDKDQKSKTINEHEAKSSTDSRNPPSLLSDLIDGNDDDESWENWPTESPVHHKNVSTEPGIRHRSSIDEDEPQEGSTNVSVARAQAQAETSWTELLV